MERVNAIYRSKACGPSIRRVFGSLVPLLEKEYAVNSVFVPDPRADPLAMLRNLRACLRAPKADVNHITGDIHYCVFAFARRTTVLTVHDMGIYLNERGLKRWLKWLIWIYLPVRYARRVVCISERTRQELMQAVSVNPAKVSVVGNPVDAGFRHVPKRFDAACPLILHVGTKANKNLPRVAAALAGIPCRLRIIGRPDAASLAALGSAGVEYSWEEFLPDERMAEEYVKCDIVSFPSLYEGFGMPIVEAQATGRVVVASDREPMLSVAGGAAVPVDPLSVESIREGFSACINDRGLREDLVRKGLANADRFTPRHIATQYGHLYERL